MITATAEQPAIAISSAPEGHSPGCLFVSTSLATWTTAKPEQFARDVQINDTAYRRLDPEYYVWLRSRMVIAKKAATAGHLDAAAFEVLRARFNTLHVWAVGSFGEEELLAAVRRFRSGDYQPPRPEPEGRRTPAPRALKSAAADIPPEVVSLVDSISEQALSLGWKHARLYGAGGNRIFDSQRGLVWYLKPGDRIGEVTTQSIEIICPLPSKVRQRFYNPDADQPWVKKIDGAAKKIEK